MALTSLLLSLIPVSVCMAQSSTLDDAYDAGRTITTDVGAAVELLGPGGLVVEETATVGVLTITGGADIAEPFLVSGPGPVLPGLVVVIDEMQPGQLKVSGQAYDRRVAGVVAGAGSLRPGLRLTGHSYSDEHSFVALTGLVYVYADATPGAIEPGDVLTTSDLTGHAMRVNDFERARGAVLGKAMSALPEGQGLVLMLVSLL